VSRKAAWQQDQPSERAERAERRRKLLEALSCLNADQRFAVTAHYFEERSIAEICEAAGWSRSKVKVTLHRARTKLAKLLAQALEEDHA
jgi:RNA polymerase sigma-70 factor (ECF subfamily)